ncbi:MAG TPA: RagB/SusD family nutrient uptake outer membrane protein [Chitinophagaceae bacterium]|nr:RagB/SusD family nutrient uptake outer membrane protein [Chitinophagaceae bacterium]
MKQGINKYKYLSRALGLIVLSAPLTMMLPGCSSKFLEVEPQGKVPSVQFWITQDDITKAVSGAYSNLRGWTNVAFAPIAIESLGSDDTEKGSTAGDATFMNLFDNFTATSSQGQILDFWTGQYQNINNANKVLDNIPSISMDAGLKSRYIAEMKFIRAYSYFRLVRAFGPVPLRLHVPKDASEYNIPRSSKDSVYAVIEQDLTDAAAVLPQSYPATDIGRATKGAALALHAKVCMYQKKWTDVLNYTNQVMGLGYSLFPNYEQQFRIANENNIESIFEIQCTYLPSNIDASNSQYSQVQANKDVAPSVGWGFNVPTQDLVNEFEAGDPRKDATILFAGETTPEGDVVPVNPAGSPSMYNQKSYVPFALAAVDNQGADQNVRVLRFADVLLMNAEAANETGNSALALTSLEKVRARARAGNNAILPKVTTTDQTALRTAIWHERRVELAMEFDRFFDVIRQGRGAAVFGPKGFKAGKNEVWPLPQNEIDLSAGLLTQNPGY